MRRAAQHAYFQSAQVSTRRALRQHTRAVLVGDQKVSEPQAAKGE
eukprot:COSAG01_NODE_11825_length_1852_cov_1.065031_2_plen_45_part_00